MTMPKFKQYTAVERLNNDEYYTGTPLILEHLRLTFKYLGIDESSKFATAWGVNNPYTKVLKNMGADVKEYQSFEDLLDGREVDRFVIDNPPFSTASKDRLQLDKVGFKYSLLASGTRFPKSHKYGAILLEQPRQYFTNRPEQVLCLIMHNVNDNIYSEYKKDNPNKYIRAFIAVNLDRGIYKNKEII